MKTQLKKTFDTSDRSDVYMIGFVSPIPSVVKRNAKNAQIAGAPRTMALA
ncbi:MAG: hypothetical protein AAF417_01940 [Pseudomonadota bacterium]